MLAVALKLIVAGAALYGVAAGVLYWRQRALIYRPSLSRMAPAEAGLAGVAEVILRTPDGEHLIAWWAKAAPGRPTLLYFHGNAGAKRFAKQDDVLRRQAGA